MDIRPTLAGLLFLASCGHRVAEPTETLPLEIPRAFAQDHAPAAGALADSWWQDFDSPELASLLAGVEEANPDLQIAQASYRQTEALAAAAGGARWPSLSAGLQASRSRQNLIGLPIPGAGEVLPIRATSFGLSADLSWEVDLWGRIDAAVAAADADALAAQAELQAAQLSLRGQAVQLWLGRTEALSQLALVEELRALAEQRLQHLEARFERGTTSASEVLRARQAVTTWQANAKQLRLQVSAQQRALQSLRGQYPDGAWPESATVTLPELPPAPPVGMPAELLGRRPDLAAAEARYYAATARARSPRLALPAARADDLRRHQQFGDRRPAGRRLPSLESGRRPHGPPLPGRPTARPGRCPRGGGRRRGLELRP